MQHIVLTLTFGWLLIYLGYLSFLRAAKFSRIIFLLLLLFIQAIYDYMALHNTSHFWMSMVKYEYHRW